MKSVKYKWMVTLNEVQYTWIKDVASKSSVTGADVMRALINEATELNSSEFRRSLMSSQLKSEIQALEEKEYEIAIKKKELTAKLNGKERVIA